MKEVFECPRCKSRHIYVKAEVGLVLMPDGGTLLNPLDVSWGRESYAICQGCPFEGLLRDFETAKLEA